MPRLNGKFVSQAAYDAAEAEIEEFTVSEYETNESGAVEVPAEEKTDKRRGTRPATVLKRAVVAQINAELALKSATAELDAHEEKAAALTSTRDQAAEKYADASAAVRAARENV